MSTFFEEVADAVMETKPVQAGRIGVSTVFMLGTSGLRNALAAAAKMGAEGATALTEEHDAEGFNWVCKKCGNPIALNDEDRWVHV